MLVRLTKYQTKTIQSFHVCSSKSVILSQLIVLLFALSSCMYSHSSSKKFLSSESYHILQRYVPYSPEGKRPLGRPRRRWGDNIRMDLQEVGLGYGDWIGLAQDRERWRAHVSAVRNLRVP